MGYSFYLKKENFKFSSAHFTIFNKTDSEALHGHNYRVGIHLKSSRAQLENEMICDFNFIKKCIKSVCDELDEKVLIPQQSPHLKISNHVSFKDHIHVVFHQKNYVFPISDIYLMSCENITSEALAYFIAQKIAPEMKTYFYELKVSVEETRGQTASYTMSL